MKPSLLYMIVYFDSSCYNDCYSAHTQAQQGMLDKQSEPFGIRAKIFWDVSETQMVTML